MSELFDAKELAKKLKRNVSYVYAMRARGFRMPGGRATVDAAIIWLETNPKPKGMKVCFTAQNQKKDKKG